MNGNIKKFLVGLIALLVLTNAFLLINKYLKKNKSDTIDYDFVPEHVTSISNDIDIKIFTENEIFVGLETNFKCTKIGDRFEAENVIWSINDQTVNHNSYNFLDFTFDDTLSYTIKVCYSSIDKCQETIVRAKFKDTDDDGYFDKDDDCIEIPGGNNSINGCPDFDNDGVVDVKDNCPKKWGPVSNNGCPEENGEKVDNKKQKRDTDGDGIVDSKDNCPTERGPSSNNGCPEQKRDTDGDGIEDNKDKCPTERGPISNNGCPNSSKPLIKDTDNDGVPDNVDRCKTIKGLKEFDGCPPPDKDGDGIPDDKDKCPDEKGEKGGDGCPEKTEVVRLQKRGDLRLVEDTSCPKGVNSYSIGPTRIIIQVKRRVQLRTISVVSNSNWEAQLTLKTSQNKIIGSTQNENILDGVTEINLTQLNKYIEPGQYTLEISGSGQLGNISDCLTSNTQNSQLGISQNKSFFLLDYKY